MIRQLKYKYIYVLIGWLMISCVSFTSCKYLHFDDYRDSLFLITDHVDYYYDLRKPEAKHFLPYVLSEISGLTYKEPNTVLTIQDEIGKLFEYNLDQRKITNVIHFKDAGDFEGVELVDGEVIVLESNGTLYFFPDQKQKEVKARVVETKLETENDTEGFGYDPTTNTLLIACKASADLDKKDIKGKAVFGFSLKDQTLSEEPVFNFTTKDMEKFLEANRDMDYDHERIKYKPSAIAYNPIDKYFYIMASVGKMILVMDREGTIKATYPLSPALFDQPEGLCFAPNGDMYISSEGDDEKGYIIKYSIRKK